MPEAKQEKLVIDEKEIELQVSNLLDQPVTVEEKFDFFAGWYF